MRHIREELEEQNAYLLAQRLNKENEQQTNNNPKMRTYLGIDPGSNGGLAWLDEDGSLLECIKMPSTPQDILDALRTYNPDSVVCFIEDVGNGMPGQSSKATATFARHNGHLEMALLACGISTIKVTPAKWQKALGLSGKKGESITSHKNRIKAKMQALFPKQKVTLWAADALAIASYGFEMRR